MAKRTIFMVGKPHERRLYSPSPPIRRQSRKSVRTIPIQSTVTKTYKFYEKDLPISPLYAQSLSHLYAAESSPSLFRSKPSKTFGVTSGSKLNADTPRKSRQQKDMGEKATKPHNRNVLRPVLRQGSSAVNMDINTSKRRDLLPGHKMEKRTEVEKPDQAEEIWPKVLVPHTTIYQTWLYPSHGSLTTPVARPSKSQDLTSTASPVQLRMGGRDRRCNFSERSAMLVFARARVAKRDFAEPFCKLSDSLFKDWFLRTVRGLGVDDEWAVCRLATVMKDEARAVVMEEVEIHQREVEIVAMGREEDVWASAGVVSMSERRGVSRGERRGRRVQSGEEEARRKEEHEARRREEHEGRKREFWNGVEMQLRSNRQLERERARREDEGCCKADRKSCWPRYRPRIPGTEWVKVCFRWLFGIKKEQRQAIYV
ncbi:hypothetical protein PTMSG1_06076 [Pyrenophora teres f. maculata]|nr:hypothetical protein PTMSG1_06076 [Pyrenophora teres f. maculata]